MQTRKHILVTPQSSLLKRDKHLELLYSALTKNGYHVSPFSIFKLLKLRNNAIWHIHWIEVFHTGKIRRSRMKNHSNFVSCLRFIYFIFLVFLCKLFGVRILWTIHNVASHERPDTIFERIVTKLLLVFSDRVTSINNHIKNEIRERYGFTDIVLMKQGLYDGGYADTVTRAEARQLLGLDDKDFVLVFLGGIEEYKGIDIAMEAMEEINDMAVKLVVAGRLNKDSEYCSRIHALAERNKNIILFDTFIPDGEVQNYFRAADYTIYPYRRIDNSGPLYLTLTFGVPTIIRGAGGISEIINLNPNVAIQLTRPDKTEIAQAIRKARSTKVDDSEFNVYRERLSWDCLENDILQVFKGLQN